MRKSAFILLIFISFSSCLKENLSPSILTESQIDLSTHKLTVYSAIKNSKYLVVFESGLGDDHTTWEKKNIVSSISQKIDIVTYDRAGYGKSGQGLNPRNISKLSSELAKVIEKFANGRKVILVGHSWGGAVIRDYAIKNPTKTAALLFLDPSHELYNSPDLENTIYEIMLKTYGANAGPTTEIRELSESLNYLSKLSNLPNIPVTVITSMKIDEASKEADAANKGSRQKWYDAHEQLRKGVNDFIHIKTLNSGHFIQVDEPNLVLEHLNTIIAKL